ncbi:MAG: MFS transporter [Proteobacteria bacterium]|nr:MFS transporter [Pseudomonadota bacterium]
MKRTEKGVFYGWYLVGVAMFGNFIGAGTGFYVFNAFLNPLCDTYGWSRTQFNAAPGIGFFMGMFGTLACGFLLRRFSIRSVMACGSLIAGISFIFLGRVGNIWMFYFIFVLLSLGNVAISGIVANTLISNWFVKKRGKALGVASVGISLSGVILPYLASFILKMTDLKTAFLLIGCLILVLLPVAMILVRDFPENEGLLPDGSSEGLNGENSGATSLAGDELADNGLERIEWTLPDMLRSGAFWKIGIAYGLAVASISSIMFQLAPRFISLGYSSQQAMLVLTFTALMGAIGKYVWGMLCDHFEPKRVAAVCMTGTGLGLLVGLMLASTFGLVLFVLCFGFSMGGLMSTHPVMVANFFGRYSFTAVYKYISLFFIIEIPGFILMGRTFDLTGSYDGAFIFFIAICFVAAALTLSIKPPKLAPNGSQT